MYHKETQQWGELIDQRNDSDFSLRIKSNQSIKSAITVTMSCAVEVYDISEPDNPVLDRTETVGSGESSFPAWFVGVGEIKAKLSNAPDSTYITAPSEVVLLVGSICTFKAIRTPSDAPEWPSGKPVWTRGSHIEQDDYIEIEANNPVSATLTCECGNKKKKKLLL